MPAKELRQLLAALSYFSGPMNDQWRALANHFLSGVAEHLLGAPIPEGNQAVLIRSHDGHEDGCIQNCFLETIGRGESGFGHFAAGYFALHGHEFHQAAPFVNRLRVHIYPIPTTTLCIVDDLDMKSQAAPDRFPHHRNHFRIGEGALQKITRFFSFNLVERPARYASEAFIYPFDTGLSIGKNDGIGDSGGNHRELAIGLIGFFFSSEGTLRTTAKKENNVAYRDTDGTDNAPYNGLPPPMDAHTA